MNWLPLSSDGKLDISALPSPVSSKRDNLDQAYSAPTNNLERSLVKIWGDILWLEDEIGINDNFYALGGHSLLAVQLINRLENFLDAKLSANTIIKLSSIKNLALSIENEKKSLSNNADKSSLNIPGITPDTHHGLLKLTASWEGKRLSDESIIVGRNIHGKCQPIFWCFQGDYEFMQLSKYLGEDQPIYGMRSGHLLMEDEQQNIDALACYYTSEIVKIQPAKPYIIGGNCQSAKIAFQIAKRLMNEGKEITLLCLQEQFIPQHYHGRVAFFYGKDSGRNPLHYFNQPEESWKKFYSQPFTINVIPGRHGKFFKEPNIQVLSTALEKEIRLAQKTPQSQQAIKLGHDEPKCLPNHAYLASIISTEKINLSPGEKLSLQVTIKNISGAVWGTENNRPNLGYKWLNKRGRNILFVDPGNPLSKALKPNEKTYEILAITAPNATGRYTYEIDMVDYSVWFQSKGSVSNKVSVHVSRWFYPISLYRKLFKKPI
jgi:thioesterase domain-containing protein/acyl carrier protein